MLRISGVQAAAISYLGEFHCIKNRAKYVTLAAMFMPLSIVYQPAMALFILPMSWEINIFGFAYGPWRMFVLTSSFVNLLAFLSISFLPESPKFMLAMAKPDQALDILKIAYSSNTGHSKDVSLKI